MFDLLTTTESAVAEGQGWQLAWVVEEHKTLVQVLPSWTIASITNAEQAYRKAMDMAKANDAVALRALQLCVLSRQPTKKPTRRKKQ